MVEDRSPRKRQIENNESDYESDNEEQSQQIRNQPSSPLASQPPHSHLNRQGGSSVAPSPNPLPSSPGLPFEQDDSEAEFLDVNDEDQLIPDADVDEQDRLEEETGVDLIGDDMARDYTARPEEDTYDGALDIDDADYQAMDANERRRVDRLLDARDELHRGNNLDLDMDRDALNADLDAHNLPAQVRRHRHRYDEDQDDYFDDLDGQNEELSLEQLADVKAPSIMEWIIRPNVARSIARELKNFLLEYTDDQGRSVYGSRIRTLGELNSESLEVSYQHLLQSKAVLALFLTTCPEEMLKVFDVIAMEATELHYPDYSQIHSEIHVRIADYPTIHNLRELRESNLNSLTQIKK
ncbi:unnamed protein product [Ambrosiozyma monospora]|uniref:Unnamed protein product n=1 Tax=Ambrosiozyma monospora TaxID=43982 RepID=A0ACB5TT47_AMBMO|nr:unnamed protein product [Ambrosiozyma monospora]